MTERHAETEVIGVAVVEDQAETREGISFLINHTAGFECRHVYPTAEVALENIGIDPPRVALLDIGLPGLDGIEAVRILQERHPRIAPVMLTVYKDNDRIFQAICAGACGYLLKQTPPARLMEAIRQVADGGAVMSPEVAIRVVELFRKAPVRDAGWVALSPRERELLKLLTEGHQNKTAAAELGISVHTVSFHLRSIYEKLHVHSRSEAVARALRDGLVK
ncbi:response regulator transcription factor [Nevskia soli]|uniref:response regulator transcription factor n=1 Tax=Nevskia soli TaxID=418856 RepID=UPI001C5C98BC|nr:response regulator transcription factor [Nevskia soli]